MTSQKERLRKNWGSQAGALKRQMKSVKSMKYSQTICRKLAQEWNPRLSVDDRTVRRVLTLHREIFLALVAQLDETDDRVRELEALVNAQGEQALKNLDVKSVGREAARALRRS